MSSILIVTELSHLGISSRLISLFTLFIHSTSYTKTTICTFFTGPILPVPRHSSLDRVPAHQLHSEPKLVWGELQILARHSTHTNVRAQAERETGLPSSDQPTLETPLSLSLLISSSSTLPLFHSHPFSHITHREGSYNLFELDPTRTLNNLTSSHSSSTAHWATNFTPRWRQETEMSAITTSSRSRPRSQIEVCQLALREALTTDTDSWWNLLRHQVQGSSHHC